MRQRLIRTTKNFLRHYHSCPPTPLPLHRFLSDPPTTFPLLQQTHALLITTNLSTNPFFAAKLISLYSCFKHPDLSALVFNSVFPTSDAFLCNTVIQSQFSNGGYDQSIELFSQMRRGNVFPTHFTIPMVASACGELGDLGIGVCLHVVSIKLGFLLNVCRGLVAVGSSFVYMYSKCGVIDDAIKVFEEMPVKDVVSWTAIITGCVGNEECELSLSWFREMLRDGGERPNSRTIHGGIRACASFEGFREFKVLHGFSVKNGTTCCSLVQSVILSVYSRFGTLREATSLFHEMNEKDVVSWTTIVGSYARKGLVVECLALFEEMTALGIVADGVFVSCLLMAFTCSHWERGAKAFHAVILRKSYAYDAVVHNSLMAMYCELDLPGIAGIIFHAMAKRDEEAWNLMITKYGHKGLILQCLDTFREMQFLHEFVEQQVDSLIAVISSISQTRVLNLGKSIHRYVFKSNFNDSTSILNSLISMYGRCGRIDISKRIFGTMTRDIVTWNTMISMYVQMGNFNDALTLFDEMLLQNIKPNCTTLKVILSACSSVAALQQGDKIHEYIKEEGLEHDVVLQTALIDMFSKCGNLKISREIFDSMHEKDVVSWNVMISGYANHGFAEEALQVFKHMEEIGARPNEITFLAVLSACSHAGLVEEGKNLFNKMKNFYSLVHTCKHYACIVDLFGRSGKLNEAEDVILKMPISYDGGVWGALLGACSMYNNIEMGERAAKVAIELEPDNDGYYVLLANLYDSHGRWKDAEEVREAMMKRGMTRQAGLSVT